MESAEGRRATVVETLAGYLVQERGASPEDARARAHRLIDQANEEVRGAVQAFAGHWWLFTLRGVLSVIVGFLFFANPAQALATLVLLIGAWLLVDGVFELLTATFSERSWALALAGAAGIFLGWMILSRPAAAAVMLFILIAAWALAHGVSEMVFGVRMPKGAEGRGGLIGLGALSCLFGVMMLAAPLLGVLALSAWIGAYALVYGVSLIVVSLRLRKFRGAETKLPPSEGMGWRRHAHT